MVMRQHTMRRPIALPPTGARTIWLGDSISDLTVGTGFDGGKYIATLCSTYGWKALNSTMIANGSFEADATGWVTVQGTLAQDTLHPSQGTKSMKITAAAAAVTAGPEADSGAMRLGLQAATTYTFAADFFVPTTITGTVSVAIWDRVGAGAYQSTSVNITAANSIQRVAVTRTIQTGATEAFVRISWTSATVGNAIWIDGAQLEPGTVANAYADGLQGLPYSRAGIAGTLLQSTNNTTANFLANAATRFTAWTPVEMVCMHLGTNDLGSTSNGGNFTRATWAAAMESALQLFTAQSPAPLVVVFSLGFLTYNDSTALGATWGLGSTRGNAYEDMNLITRQLCRDYGAVRVDLTGMTSGMMRVDNIHPNAATGHPYIVSQFKAAFGQ